MEEVKIVPKIVKAYNKNVFLRQKYNLPKNWVYRKLYKDHEKQLRSGLDQLWKKLDAKTYVEPEMEKWPEKAPF